MAKAHEASFAPFDPLDECRHLVDRSNLGQHPRNGFIRAAVQRPVERRGRAGKRRVRIGVRAADAPHRVRAAVLLVVRVQDEEDIERPLQHGVRFVSRLGHLEQHVQEVPGEAQLVVGQHVRPADGVAEDVGRDAGNFRDEPNRLELARCRIEDVAGIRVERRQRPHGAEEHPHRVRVVAEAFEKLLDVLVQHRVTRDLLRPLVQLRRRGEFSEEKKVSGLEVVAVLGQLVNRVPAIHQDTAIAVDERNPAAARRGVHERRVVAQHPEVVRVHLDLAEIHRPNRVVLDGNLVFPARSVVSDGQRVGHVYSISSSSTGSGGPGTR